MGLLDDAIRDHLDLKRRRGADPTEIAREESEALGPVRRGEVDLGDDPEALELHDDPDQLDLAAAPAPELVPDPPPAAATDVHPVPESESTTPPHGDPFAQQATREFSAHEVDDALGDPRPGEEPDPDVVAADAGDEDVLEETPDFLQETPEHDRLWFEQKPPKDFDF